MTKNNCQTICKRDCWKSAWRKTPYGTIWRREPRLSALSHDQIPDRSNAAAYRFWRICSTRPSLNSTICRTESCHQSQSYFSTSISLYSDPGPLTEKSLKKKTSSHHTKSPSNSLSLSLTTKSQKSLLSHPSFALKSSRGQSLIYSRQFTLIYFNKVHLPEILCQKILLDHLRSVTPMTGGTGWEIDLVVLEYLLVCVLLD